MAEVEKYKVRGSVIWRILSASLTRRLIGLAGLVMVITGYWMILNTADLPKSADLEAVTRHAVGGMALVVCGGVVEVLVLLVWARR
jgi:hypothetical protein